MTLQATPASVATDDRVRTDGMVAAAAVPVFDAQRRLAGVIYGGNLLNRRIQLVDAIKPEVFPPQIFTDRRIGNVTVFQGDLRIATNVVTPDGARAVGTRLSREVYEKVLERGGTGRRRPSSSTIGTSRPTSRFATRTAADHRGLLRRSASGPVRRRTRHGDGHFPA